MRFSKVLQIERSRFHPVFGAANLGNECVAMPGNDGDGPGNHEVFICNSLFIKVILCRRSLRRCMLERPGKGA
ncbi:protein of unknown function [Burkholderia multivorans]